LIGQSVALSGRGAMPDRLDPPSWFGRLDSLISTTIRKGESMLLQLGRVSLLAALTMFIATAAQAAEEGHGDPPGTPPLLSFDIGSAVCNIAIFLGVLAILSKFVWPVILGGLQAREDKIHEDLEAAERANDQAKSLLADYQAKLDDAATKVQAMLSEARKDGEATGQRIVEDAKAEAERQRERAVADIETAKKVALSELAGQTSDMAINVAKQVVGRELKADDHANLIRQALDRLPSSN
jgi:F-type H+-transporting ATPase subunit b